MNAHVCGGRRVRGPAAFAATGAVTRTESPGNSGRWLIISTKMQPIDQMSTGVEYVLAPRRISGERYHSVTTCPSVCVCASMFMHACACASMYLHVWGEGKEVCNRSCC